MAAATPSRPGDQFNVIQYTWTLTSADATGDGVDLPDHPDKCWHVTGTWGGATAAIQGSNTNSDALYGALTNAAGGSAITWTADGAPKNSIESSRYVRPKLTTAGAGATLTVVLIARKQPR